MGAFFQSAVRRWDKPNLSPLLIIALILVCNARYLSGQSQTGTAEEAFKRGVELQQKGEFQEAASAYEAALRKGPRRVDVLSNLGLVYGRLGKYNLAIQCFQNALKIEPHQEIVRFNLGVTYMQAQKFDAAEKELAGVVSDQSHNYLARHLLALSLFKLGRMPAGISQLELVYQANPSDTEVAFTLTSAYIKAKQLDKAETLIETVIRNHDSAQASYIIGLYHVATNNFLLAIDEFKRARELDASLPDVLTQLGNAYLLAGDRKDAISTLQEVLQKRPLDFEANELLGGIYLDAGQSREAAASLAKAREARPNDSAVLFQLARIAKANNQLDQAVDLLRKVAKIKPDFTPAHVLLAETYFKLKNPTEGKREMAVVSRLQLQEQAAQSRKTAVSERYAGNPAPAF